MTREEVILQKKATTLNAIRKIYHPLSKVQYSSYREDGSYAEQRDYMVQEIMENLERELQTLKEKHKKEDEKAI
jgi:hypothetical protein